MVHVAAEQLASTGPRGRFEEDAAASVAAPTDRSTDPTDPTDPTELATVALRAPAELRAGTCYVEGQGAIESATAERLVCTAQLVGALTDSTGNVLALGRTARLASRAQRRALRVRDKSVCQFPGCHTTHTSTHTTVSRGPPGGAPTSTIWCCCAASTTPSSTRAASPSARSPGATTRFTFTRPDGREVARPWGTPHDDTLLWQLADHAAQNAHSMGRIDPERIFPPHAGAGFSLHECVDALFRVSASSPARAA